MPIYIRKLYTNENRIVSNFTIKSAKDIHKKNKYLNKTIFSLFAWIIDSTRKNQRKIHKDL